MQILAAVLNRPRRSRISECGYIGFAVAVEITDNGLITRLTESYGLRRAAQTIFYSPNLILIDGKVGLSVAVEITRRNYRAVRSEQSRQIRTVRALPDFPFGVRPVPARDIGFAVAVKIKRNIARRLRQQSIGSDG
jgi:hypothetical protein